MLSGVTSRWMKPSAWTEVNARRTGIITFSVSSTDTLPPLLAMYDLKLTPSM
jgi:hypothetical protein